jgi:hypothetical protein
MLVQDQKCVCTRVAGSLPFKNAQMKSEKQKGKETIGDGKQAVCSPSRAFREETYHGDRSSYIMEANDYSKSMTD